ncbi:helix-turn-helix transcriptional regulator [Deinococcus sp. QL22]|uniref:helix-turn-helix transcriptional regulator n=1 Tax=Deinococcus sp. QL22 TaxID=2939437 RepID=UPI002016B7D2|nr:helix-turn-helix transcriptional regulator [Deinococcus sp. QL22]UQN06326.1 helix-turn-helix transcriptional regulator [Deinococcus sp. QL22]
MTPKPRTRPKTPPPAWATALRVRRAALGKSQEQVALDSGILNQTTVSELEGGRYEVGNLTVARLSGLARGLNWTMAELEAALGLDFTLASLDASQVVVTPPKPEPRPMPLPEGLQAAIDLYGKRFADLREPRWQTYLAGFNWREGLPEDPEAWLDLYRDLTRAGIEPGGN